MNKFSNSRLAQISLLILCLSGALLLGQSLTMQPYVDESHFYDARAELSTGKTEAYAAVREQLLTPKYILQDYGITLLIAAGMLFLVARLGSSLCSSPLPSWLLITAAAALPFLTVGSVVFDLWQSFQRDAFPPWGDSLLIPLAGMPLLFALALIWSAVHLFLFWPGPRLLTQPWTAADTMIGRTWLLLLSAISTIVVFLAAAQGQYWFAVPAVAWLLFYVALWRAPRVRQTRSLAA